MQKPLSEMTKTELWQLFPIELRDYDPRWPLWYEGEKARLEALLGQRVVSVDHIGSTSVPGLRAKAIVDILLQVHSCVTAAALKDRFPAEEYLVNEHPENPPPHITFLKGYTPAGFAEQVFHIHVRHPGDYRELHFRDYLRAHPQAAGDYARVKEELARRYRHNRDGYTDAKTEFIDSIHALIDAQS